MIFQELNLKGVFMIEPEKKEDERGFFTRFWDKKEFEKKGLKSNILQSSFSFNKKKGTLRGLHFQISPFEERKMVSCTKGKIFDVILDLRKKSETFAQWKSVELNSEKHQMLYMPEGFAHGFQTLEDNSEIFYQISQIYSPSHAKGILWNDKTLRINWPLTPTIMSDRDLSFKELDKSFEYFPNP